MLRVLVPKEASSIKQVHPGRGESDEARPTQQALMSEMGLNLRMLEREEQADIGPSWDQTG